MNELNWNVSPQTLNDLIAPHVTAQVWLREEFLAPRKLSKVCGQMCEAVNVGISHKLFFLARDVFVDVDTNWCFSCISIN